MKSTFSIIFYLKRQVVKKDGTVPVMGRITVDGTQAQFSCKMTVNPNLWDTKGGRMIVLVLMVVSIITVGSTIRLSVFARRREIEIMKYVGATNHLVTLPFFVEGLTMGLISGAITSVAGIFGYAYIVQASSTLGGLWQLLMGTAMVPVDAVWPTILTYSLAGGALVGALGSMFSIRKHLNV